MKYKIVIFDLDGTLLDTLQDLADSTNFALEQMGYPLRTLDEIRRFVGNGVAKLIERALPSDTSENIVAKTLHIFKTHYAENCENHTQPYDGILPLLDTLRQREIPVAVVSNKLDSAVKSLCKKYFGDRICLALGDRDGIARKPSPDSVLSVLREMHMHANDAVYIGDSEVDIQTAKNAKTDLICVTWGFREKDFLAEQGASTFANTVSELEKMLIL